MMATCEQCGATFSRKWKPWRIPRHRFCSKSCQTTFYKPSGDKQGIQTTTICEKCHQPFEWTRRPADRIRRFCSQRCNLAFHKPDLSTHRESQSNGKSGTPTWISWHNMIQRCSDPGAANWKYYGARGVTVCDRWRGPVGFINFKADLGERPEGKTLDRRDTNGNYKPENCCWSTPKEQSANRRISQALKNHCRNGHPRTPENTYTYPNGRITCYVCKRAKTKRHNERIDMRKSLVVALTNLHKSMEGQDLLEYSLLALLVALGAIAGMGHLAASLNATFNRIAGSLT